MNFKGHSSEFSTIGLPENNTYLIYLFQQTKQQFSNASNSGAIVQNAKINYHQHEKKKKQRTARFAHVYRADESRGFTMWHLHKMALIVPLKLLVENHRVVLNPQSKIRFKHKISLIRSLSNWIQIHFRSGTIDRTVYGYGMGPFANLQMESQLMSSILIWCALVIKSPFSLLITFNC